MASRAVCRRRSTATCFPYKIEHGLVVSREFIRMHQVDAREEFVGGVDPVQVSPRYVHETVAVRHR
jgi:hypothetical protein